VIEEEKEKKEKKYYRWELSHPDRVSSFFFLNRGKKKKDRPYKQYRYAYERPLIHENFQI